MGEKVTPPIRPRDRTGAADLAIIAPERQAEIGGRLVEMREPTWLESLLIEPQLQRVGGALGADPSAMFATLLRLVTGSSSTQRGARALLSIMAMCAGVDPSWIDGLAASEREKFVFLFHQVNGHFFRPAGVERKAGARVGYAEVITVLLEHGHSLDSVKRYTRRQLTLYYDTALRRERDARADRLEECVLARSSSRRVNETLRRWRN